MSQKRCEYCRGIFKNLPLHYKECFRKKRIDKSKFNSRITQSIEYRLDVLKEFDIDTSKLPVASMTDLGFNDLVAKLYSIKKQNLEKEQEQKSLEIAQQEEIERLKKISDESEKEAIARRGREELERLEQAKRFELQVEQKKIEDAERERLNQEKQKEEPLAEQQSNILDTVLSDVVEKYSNSDKAVGQKKQRGRPKKEH